MGQNLNDYSHDTLNQELIRKFGYSAQQLQIKHIGESFNIWDAYEHLKQCLGIKDVTFTKHEYNKRMKAIIDILDV